MPLVLKAEENEEKKKIGFVASFLLKMFIRFGISPAAFSMKMGIVALVATGGAAATGYNALKSSRNAVDPRQATYKMFAAERQSAWEARETQENELPREGVGEKISGTEGMRVGFAKEDGVRFGGGPNDSPDQDAESEANKDKEKDKTAEASASAGSPEVKPGPPSKLAKRLKSSLSNPLGGGGGGMSGGISGGFQGLAQKPEAQPQPASVPQGRVTAVAKAGRGLSAIGGAKMAKSGDGALGQLKGVASGSQRAAQYGSAESAGYGASNPFDSQDGSGAGLSGDGAGTINDGTGLGDGTKTGVKKPKGKKTIDKDLDLKTKEPPFWKKWHDRAVMAMKAAMGMILVGSLAMLMANWNLKAAAAAEILLAAAIAEAGVPPLAPAAAKKIAALEKKIAALYAKANAWIAKAKTALIAAGVAVGVILVAAHQVGAFGGPGGQSALGNQWMGVGAMLGLAVGATYLIVAGGEAAAAEGKVLTMKAVYLASGSVALGGGAAVLGKGAESAGMEKLQEYMNKKD
ncbi:MAG: hypothetical protein A3G41_07695 [Elusimicrobia bacterium RIFCSPLOWO2_12_FULL_59_9]|nr:MAG: hypothetical protein A3G41_07695 [Elusimicrobia bacterium RIFCSPLOWO2_12_FULL_59_9]